MHFISILNFFFFSFPSDVFISSVYSLCEIVSDWPGKVMEAHRDGGLFFCFFTVAARELKWNWNDFFFFDFLDWIFLFFFLVEIPIQNRSSTTITEWFLSFQVKVWPREINKRNNCRTTTIELFKCSKHNYNVEIEEEKKNKIKTYLNDWCFSIHMQILIYNFLLKIDVQLIFITFWHENHHAIIMYS